MYYKLHLKSKVKLLLVDKSWLKTDKFISVTDVEQRVNEWWDYMHKNHNLFCDLKYVITYVMIILSNVKYKFASDRYSVWDKIPKEDTYLNKNVLIEKISRFKNRKKFIDEILSYGRYDNVYKDSVYIEYMHDTKEETKLNHIVELGNFYDFTMRYLGSDNIIDSLYTKLGLNKGLFGTNTLINNIAYTNQNINYSNTFLNLLAKDSNNIKCHNYLLSEKYKRKIK